MTEYIERQKAIFPLYRWKNIIKNTYGENDEYVRCLTEAIEKIENVPAADVQPVRHGRWIKKRVPDEKFRCEYHIELRCSCCDEEGLYMSPYCPNCGCKVDGKENE